MGELVKAPNGLQYVDLEVGTGPKAWKGAMIQCNYIGRLENDKGRIFDQSKKKPLGFTVGVGEVIQGWDLGICGCQGIPPMREGGRRKLVIPPEMGYGKAGSGPIPGNSTLVFEVELIDCERNSEDEEEEEEEDDS
eukprot:CAMPEP_0202877542 /NCGR_PEP_ID=MMETSP1391-20130828/30808_1 /ASSEMBLY_ACC=CAM_ASM_000867 /TAXON_ID=1034604 /ORGANISM="Chlamydomonas leiostraca, Strain SAG 11-49" /LENGTH=135 /DNA_ID=CAMNT_0049559593 /DNA_START=178 /DNA_END=585 /DNA_ORIENTATION=-